MGEISCHVCAVPPRQSEISGGARRDVDGKQQVPNVARPLLSAGETRQRGRAKGYLPLWRVAWRSGHCVVGSKRGQKEVLRARDCTGLVRKKPGFGVRGGKSHSATTTTTTATITTTIEIDK